MKLASGLVSRAYHPMLTNTIVDSEIISLDWSSILDIFGYCIILLFKPNGAVGYNNYISNSIHDLQAKVRWDVSKKLDIPFEVTKAKAG